MEAILAVLVGCLYASGIYMILRRTLAKLIIGLMLLAHGSHLLIFTAANVIRAKPPVIPDGAEHMPGISTDPLPQAVILTAIVISFGLTAFTIIMIKQMYLKVGESDIANLDEHS